MSPCVSIQLIKWPGNSPDINSFENAWSLMKVQLRETKPTNLKELKDEIRKLWVLRMDDSEEIGQVHACQDPGGD